MGEFQGKKNAVSKLASALQRNLDMGEFQGKKNAGSKLASALQRNLDMGELQGKKNAGSKLVSAYKRIGEQGSYLNEQERRNAGSKIASAYKRLGAQNEYNRTIEEEEPEPEPLKREISNAPSDMSRASTIIQSMYRGYRQRRADIGRKRMPYNTPKNIGASNRIKTAYQLRNLKNKTAARPRIRLCWM